MESIVLVWALTAVASFLPYGVSATSVTNLTLVYENLGWNDAYRACRAMGGYLVQIQDETKLNAVIHIWELLRTPNQLYGISIGMADTGPGHNDYRWIQSCDRLTWSKWEDGEPKTDKPCGRLTQYTYQLASTTCSYKRHYMCEISSDIACRYDIIEDMDADIDDGGTIGQTSAAMDTCRTACDTRSLDNGVECWGFSFNERLQMCKLFYTTNPFLLDNTTLQFTSPGNLLHLRRCYNGDYGKSFDPQRVSTDGIPAGACPIRQNTTENEHEMTHLETTKRSWMVDTARTSVFHSSTLSGSLDVTTSPKLVDTIPPQNDTSQKMSFLHFISDSSNSRSSTYPSVARATPDAKPSIATRPVSTVNMCRCVCAKYTTNETQSIEEVLEQLTLNKTQLSSVRRKFYSVPDDRPVATGIGYSGILFLALTFVIILLLDASTYFSRMKCLDGGSSRC